MAETCWRSGRSISPLVSSSSMERELKETFLHDTLKSRQHSAALSRLLLPFDIPKPRLKHLRLRAPSPQERPPPIAWKGCVRQGAQSNGYHCATSRRLYPRWGEGRQESDRADLLLSGRQHTTHEYAYCLHLCVRAPACTACLSAPAWRLADSVTASGTIRH